MSSIQDIYQIRKQMKKIYNKVNLLNKKKTSFGLTAEEEAKLSELRSQSWLLHEELIESHLNITVMPYLVTKEYNEALTAIQGMIPWSGGFVRKEEDLNGILDKFLDLSEDDKQRLSNKLEFMHILICQSFEDLCSSEEGYEHIREASKVITIEEDGNILDVLVYLDSRYRELADLLDIELQEVEVMWEDDDECQD